MWFARAILVLVIIGSGAFYAYAWPGILGAQNAESPPRFLLAACVMVITLPFPISALMTLVLSFAPAARLQGGRLVLRKESAYWRFISVLATEEDLQNLNICKLFWLTIIAFILPMGVLLIVGLMAGLVVEIATGPPGRIAQSVANFKTDWPLMALVLAGVGVIMASVISFASAKKLGRLLSVSAGLLLSVLAAAILFFLTPMVAITRQQQIAWSDALPIYWARFQEAAPVALVIIAVIMAVAAAVATLMALLVLSFKGLRRTTLGQVIWQFFGGVKTQTCPLVEVIDPSTPQEPSTSPQ